MFDFGSVYRGIRAMKRGHGKVNYAVDFRGFKQPRFWIEAWTPVWHEQRGPYITIGLWFVRITRGY